MFRQLATLERVAFVQEILRRNWMNLNYMRRTVVVQPIVNVIQPLIVAPIIVQPLVVVLPVQLIMVGSPPLESSVSPVMQIAASASSLFPSTATQGQVSGLELHPILSQPGSIDAAPKGVRQETIISSPLPGKATEKQEILTSADVTQIDSHNNQNGLHVFRNEDKNFKPQVTLTATPDPIILPEFINNPVPVVK
jgi:hypothetical protein